MTQTRSPSWAEALCRVTQTVPSMQTLACFVGKAGNAIGLERARPERPTAGIMIAILSL